MAENDIFGAYKRKEYGWFALYIAAVVIAWKLAGVVGGVVSVLVVAGIYKTVKSSASTATKIALSTLYVVGGGVATYLGVMLLVGFILPQIFGQQAINNLNPDIREAETRTLSDQPFTSSSTPSTSGAAEEVSSTLQNPTTPSPSAQTNPNMDSYKDPQWGFSIQYPKGWLLITDSEDATVQFDTPRQDEVALITVTAESSSGYDLQTYSKLVQQGFFSSEGGPNANLKIIAQGNSTLNGHPVYQFEVTSDFINAGETYPFHGLYTVAVKDGVGYVIFGSSFEQRWAAHRDLFKASVASFRFPN